MLAMPAPQKQKQENILSTGPQSGLTSELQANERPHLNDVDGFLHNDTKYCLLASTYMNTYLYSYVHRGTKKINKLDKEKQQLIHSIVGTEGGILQPDLPCHIATLEPC